MRLNPDVIRDLLFAVEVRTTPDQVADSDYIYSTLSQYDSDTVQYHVKQAELSGVFTKVEYFYGSAPQPFLILDLSPEGHKFINNIRNDNSWSKTKDVATSIGNFSFDALKSISSSVAAEFLSRQLGLK
ncbi:DUF2513 domain-containing protein [Lactococcus garvieae]|uniref:DUF2513 domain-containing protein n=1 Tax=Lactococcus garvieae TaxID=1363 RepID=UPI003132B9A8